MSYNPYPGPDPQGSPPRLSHLAATRQDHRQPLPEPSGGGMQPLLYSQQEGFYMPGFQVYPVPPYPVVVQQYDEAAPPPGPAQLTQSQQPATLGMMTSSHSHMGKSGPRRRSLTACDTCRQKKSKCDNVRPRCGACVRAGNTKCHYRVDDADEPLDPSLARIMTKLDDILEEVRRSEPSRKRHRPVRDSKQKPWDMLLVSMLRWPYLRQVAQTLNEDVGTYTSRLVRSYDRAGASYSVPLLKDHFDACGALERVLQQHLPAIVSSFLLNCHTKVPCLDIITLLELVEVYTLIKRAVPTYTFLQLLEDKQRGDASAYERGLATFGIPYSHVRQRAYENCCNSVPLLLVVCALGVLATPLRLNNMEMYATLVAERSAMDTCCVPGGNGIPDNRAEFSHMFVTYAAFLAASFPSSLCQNSLVAVEYHIMLSQYHLYCMDPLKAHGAIVQAATHMTFFLEKEKVYPQSLTQPHYRFGERKGIVDRLFWTCLKMESELQAELSPFVPNFGVSLLVPPSSFLRIPSPVLPSEHLPECVQLASRHDDQNLWFYFLTEIAVRKVDNKLYDEVFSADAVNSGAWDEPRFAEKTIWKILIKYINQYNGIVASLSPRIRNFVLSEVNEEEVYASMKRRAARRERYEYEHLGDFLVDEDLLVRAQLELIIYIKTRLVVSKLVLFRPFIYLVLEDKVSFDELAEAAAALLPRLAVSQTDLILQEEEGLTGTASLVNEYLHVERSSSSSNFVGEELQGKMSYFDIIRQPLQRCKMDDNFHDIIEYTEGVDELDENFIRIKDYGVARKRLLRTFIQNLIALPKLNVPKIGVHRHPGLWYYLRNFFTGLTLQFLLYRKVQDVLLLRHDAEALNVVFGREIVKQTLEHGLLIFEYWREESSDCRVYIEYTERFLQRL